MLNVLYAYAAEPQLNFVAEIWARFNIPNVRKFLRLDGWAYRPTPWTQRGWTGPMALPQWCGAYSKPWSSGTRCRAQGTGKQALQPDCNRQLLHADVCLQAAKPSTQKGKGWRQCWMQLQQTL